MRSARNAGLERAFAQGTPDKVVLTAQDLLAQLAPKTGGESPEVLDKIWSKIVLKPDIKKSIRSKIDLFNSGNKAAPRGLLLYGPPGTGKSEIARLIAKSTKSAFESLTTSSLKAGFTGQTAQLVKQIWEKARSRGRCVIFVDECEGVFGRRGGLNTDSFSEDLIQEFLAQWDGVGPAAQIWVVGATNHRDRLDEAIMSRFGAEWEIGLPEALERIQILRLEFEKLEREVEIPDFAGRATTGFAGRALANVARDVCTLAANERATSRRKSGKKSSRMRVGPVDGGDIWALVISSETLRRLKTVCESLISVESLRKQESTGAGALLYGPPGTGKTQIARTLRPSGLTFIAAGPPTEGGPHRPIRAKGA